MKYYIGLCLLTRYIIAISVKYISIKYLPLLSLVGLIISFIFFRNYLNHKDGEKGFLGRKVWWNDYRLIHGFNYGAFSILALYKNKYAWLILFADVILGTFFFYSKIGNTVLTSV